MKTDNALKMKARWDMETLPAGKKAQRGLLLEVTGRKNKNRKESQRPPLNLALVIDRSGSMAQGRLAAAREAATGISRRLRKIDRLSIVAFDDEITVLLKGVRQNKAGRASARAAVAELHARSTTDLGGGWMRGARCVAEVMDGKGFENGHVILLSDGHANRGIQDPGELAGHAGAMAARGVTSSCVGIGANYSALQLDAIAESGLGNLHHSSVPEEIVDVVLGELNELTHMAAKSAELILHFPENTRARQLTSFRQKDRGHYLRLKLGDVQQGRTRRIAFLFDVPGGAEPGACLDFKAKLHWDGVETDSTGQLKIETALRVVTREAFDPKAKNRKVARVIAELFMARLGYEAMLLNERGLYREAVDLFTSSDIEIEHLVAQLEERERERFRARRHTLEQAVSSEWSGNSKLSAMSSAKKHMRSECDHRGRPTGDWTEDVPV